MSSVQGLLTRRPIGLIARTFATKPEQVPDRVKQVRETVNQALALRIDGMPVIRRIDVPVFADKRYGARADCGDTAAAMRKEFGDVKEVTVHEVKHGDLFCGVLNYAIGKQVRAGMDYSLILSSDARSYFTNETMAGVLEAACAGAKAVGVAITELTQSILEGRLANTFCLWDNEALVRVGLFDLRAAMPEDEKRAHHIVDFSKEKNGHIWYAVAGVEEAIPLSRLVGMFADHPCLAPVLPRGDGVKAYQVPDPQKDPEGWFRHLSKMGTKRQRQSELLSYVGCAPDYLMGGVMEQYRTF